jgi:hypothetical protein
VTKLITAPNASIIEKFAVASHATHLSSAKRLKCRLYIYELTKNPQPKIRLMKRISYLALVFIFLIAFDSCRKNEPAKEVYYMSAEIDGNPTSFKNALVADTIMWSGRPTYILNAVDTAAKFLNFMFVNFNSSTLLLPQTYAGFDNDYSLQCHYKPNASIEFINRVPDFRVNIQTINSKYIEGTFEGIMWSTSNFQDTVKFTNGKFKIPFL